MTISGLIAPQDTDWALRKGNWRELLTTAEWQRLTTAGTKRMCARGAVIFAPDTAPHAVYFLERGWVRITRIDPNGEEISFGCITPGELFGELAVFEDYQRGSFALALRESVVWELPASVMRDIFESRPALALHMLRQVATRLRRSEDFVTSLAFDDVSQRVTRLLGVISSFCGIEPSGDAVAIPMTQSEFATLVGATRQSVNECLRDLANRGAIRLSRGSIVVFPQRLSCPGGSLDQVSAV